MVRLGDYTVGIKCPHERTAESDIVRILDGSDYAVILRNDNDKLRASADLTIDGVYMGAFLVPPGKTVAIERPPAKDQAKKFRFDRVGGANAESAGVVAGDKNNGILRVTFIPEKERPAAKVAAAKFTFGKKEVSPKEKPAGFAFGGPDDSDKAYAFGGGAASAVSAKTAAPAEGATTLGGASTQTFTPCTTFVADTSRETTLYVQMVVRVADPVTPLHAARARSRSRERSCTPP